MLVLPAPSRRLLPLLSCCCCCCQVALLRNYTNGLTALVASLKSALSIKHERGAAGRGGPWHTPQVGPGQQQHMDAAGAQHDSCLQQALAGLWCLICSSQRVHACRTALPARTCCV
jgi:hypothetical protein